MISVRASAGQSGQQAAAGVKQQVASDSLKSTEQMSAAEGCLRFINHAWTQFHAVGESYADLLAVRKLQLCPYIPIMLQMRYVPLIGGPKYAS